MSSNAKCRPAANVLRVILDPLLCLIIPGESDVPEDSGGYPGSETDAAGDRDPAESGPRGDHGHEIPLPDRHAKPAATEPG